MMEEWVLGKWESGVLVKYPLDRGDNIIIKIENSF
jgi:hypothetical protein